MKKSKHRLYVGVDVHKTTHKAAIIPLDLLEGSENVWKAVKPLSLGNNKDDFERLDAAIRDRISDADEVIISIDHTGGHYSEPLAGFLQNKGYKVYYLEAKAVKAARERLLDQENKTDTIDSVSIAYLLYLRDIHGLSFRISASPVDLYSKGTMLRSLILQRLQFVKIVTQATNRLHQLLISVFPEGESKYFKTLLSIIDKYPTPKDILNSNQLSCFKGLKAKDRNHILNLAINTIGIQNGLYRPLIKDIALLRKEAIEKVKEITQIIEIEVKSYPHAAILLSFPCMGKINTATIMSVIKDIERWPDKKKLKKALGVYCNTWQSGGKQGKYRMGREGNREARRALFLVCFGCIRRSMPDNDFRDYYLRQVLRGKPKLKALVSTMGKLAEIIYHCLKTGELYQYQGKYKASS